MGFFSRNYRIKSFLNVLIIGVGLSWVGSAFAEPPMGIIGDVTVQNDATHPVPVVVQPGGMPRTPINFGTSFSIASDGTVNFKDIFTVPADKFLVIEYVSFRAFGGLNLTSDVRVAFRLLTTAGGEQGDHRVSPVPLISSEIAEQEGGQLVKLYADPGSTVTAIPSRGCCNNTVTQVVLEVSGYLTEQL